MVLILRLYTRLCYFILGNIIKIMLLLIKKKTFISFNEKEKNKATV